MSVNGTSKTKTTKIKEKFVTKTDKVVPNVLTIDIVGHTYYTDASENYDLDMVVVNHEVVPNVNHGQMVLDSAGNVFMFDNTNWVWKNLLFNITSNSIPKPV